MQGTVKWFNRKKGFGFVEGEDGQDYFVHYTSLPRGVFLRDNDKVSFEAAETEKGKQAKNVVLEKMGSKQETENGSEKKSSKKSEEGDDYSESEGQDYSEESGEEDSEEF